MRRVLLAFVALLVAGGSAHAASLPSAEQLLAADVPWATVQQVAGPGYWPEPPGFDTTVFQADPQPRVAVSQAFDQVGGRGLIQTRVLAFGSSTLSSDYLVSVQVVGERVNRDRPAVGEQHAYYRTTLTDGTSSTRFYFTRGPLAASVTVDHAAWSPARIAKLAAPIDAKLQQLLAGKLPGPALAAGETALLPKPAAAPGPVLGTTTIPIEAWSTVALDGKPGPVRSRLAAAGMRTLPFRRYLRRGSRTDTIETTAFTFPTAAAAQAWFARFASSVAGKPDASLPAGAAGPHSAFRYSYGSYELQFVAGRHVGDVFCWAPFTSGASAACEQATRALAQAWYKQLS
jgi:hypothetical protein